MSEGKDFGTYGDVHAQLGDDHVALVEIRRAPNNFFDRALIGSLCDAIDALDAMISGGESLLDQGVEAAVMIGIAAVTLAIARWGFRASVR